MFAGLQRESGVEWRIIWHEPIIAKVCAVTYLAAEPLQGNRKPLAKLSFVSVGSIEECS